MLSINLLFLAIPLAFAIDSPLYFRNAQGLSPLDKRATCIQQNPTCQSCFGPGSVTCVNDNTCYDPTKGQTCCANGYYCDAGSYCVDGGAGCCPNGDSLSDCDATAVGSTIAPPPATTASPSASSSVPASVPSSTLSATPAPVSTSASLSSTVVVLPSATSYTVVATGLPHNVTSSMPAMQTTNAGNAIAGDIFVAFGVWLVGFLL